MVQGDFPIKCGGPRYNNHVAACFHLVSPLEIQQQEQQQKERVPDGHGRSFGSWPWQKYGGDISNNSNTLYKLDHIIV